MGQRAAGEGEGTQGTVDRGVPLRTSTLTLLETKMGHFSTLLKDKRPNFMTLIHFVSHRELIILKFFKHHGIKFIEKNIHCWYQNLKTEDYSLPTFQLFNRLWI